MIGPAVLQSTAALHDRFVAAKPFPHVVIDEFFAHGFACALLEQFPPADASKSRNRYGAAGEKAFRRDLTALGPAYQAVHEYFGSSEFLKWLGELTGIDGLIYDKSNYGGGTHENFDGRDLRPHIDFNHHPVTRLYRRVNLIVYLNEGWQPEWGGAIAVHRDPRDPLDEAIAYPPIFNRCIVFETSEHSWHGFDRIILPPGEKHRSRKSLSIYFYTRERPEEQVHRDHTTFFVPRPLPSRYVAGYTLSRDDESELGELIGQRDRLIELYQAELGKQEPDSAQAARLRILLTELRSKQDVPIAGYATGAGAVSGWYPDGWSGHELRFSIIAERPITAIGARVRIPERMPKDTVLRIHVGPTLIAENPVIPGIADIQGAAAIAAGSTAEILISTSATVKELGVNAEARDLGFFLQRVTLEHSSADA